MTAPISNKERAEKCANRLFATGILQRHDQRVVADEYAREIDEATESWKATAIKLQSDLLASTRDLNVAHEATAGLRAEVERLQARVSMLLRANEALMSQAKVPAPAAIAREVLEKAGGRDAAGDLPSREVILARRVLDDAKLLAEAAEEIEHQPACRAWVQGPLGMFIMEPVLCDCLVSRLRAASRPEAGA